MPVPDRTAALCRAWRPLASGRAERGEAGVRPPAPSFLDPPRNHGRVRPGIPAQLRRLPRPRLVQLPLGCALEDAGDFGEQVGPAGGELAKCDDPGGFFLAAQLPPPGVMARFAEDLGDEHAVSTRSGPMILGHLARIERGSGLPQANW